MSVWRSNDPLIRWLRVVSLVASLALVVVVVVSPILDPARDDDIPLVALLLGAVLLQLGYEVVVPGLSKKVTEVIAAPKEEPAHDS